MSMRWKLGCLTVLLSMMSISSSAGCQLVLGRVLNKESGAPFRQIEIALVPDTTLRADVFLMLAKATTDTSGAFHLDASPVRALPNQPAPLYPDEMRKSGIQGEVLAQFIVDTRGHADMSTFKVLRATHEEFTYAVRIALPKIAFVPAELKQRKVRQLVQMPFHFCINGGPRPLLRPDTSAYWWVPKVSAGVCPL